MWVSAAAVGHVGGERFGCDVEQPEHGADFGQVFVRYASNGVHGCLEFLFLGGFVFLEWGEVEAEQYGHLMSFRLSAMAMALGVFVARNLARM